MAWTQSDVNMAVRILGRHPVSDFQRSMDAVGRKLGRTVSRSSLSRAFIQFGLGSPTSYCKGGGNGRSRQAEAAKPQGELPVNPRSELLQKLVATVRRGPVGMEELCDKLNLSPARTKSLLKEAAKAGVNVQIEHGHIGIRATVPDDRVKKIGVAPAVGDRQRVAVISDLHLGSKYCLRDQLREFVQYAYDSGIRDVLCPGDLLDGIYRHGIFELTHTGLDSQTQDLFEVLPKLPGLSYHCITGNHDFTFAEKNGISVGKFMASYFKERGREDLHFYGDRGAFLKLGGAVIHLWHPKSGCGYAKSYQIQNQINKYTAIKPQILLVGHWHIYCHVYERGVHGIACPTFQGGGSAFGKSLGGSPAIGGLVLSWQVTAGNTIRHFSIEKTSYFEVEDIYDPRNPLDANAVRQEDAEIQVKKRRG
jgi:hypothetical protein